MERNVTRCSIDGVCAGPCATKGSEAPQQSFCGSEGCGDGMALSVTYVRSIVCAMCMGTGGPCRRRDDSRVSLSQLLRFPDGPDGVPAGKKLEIPVDRNCSRQTARVKRRPGPNTPVRAHEIGDAGSAAAHRSGWDAGGVRVGYRRCGGASQRVRIAAISSRTPVGTSPVLNREFTSPRDQGLESSSRRTSTLSTRVPLRSQAAKRTDWVRRIFGM